MRTRVGKMFTRIMSVILICVMIVADNSFVSLAAEIAPVVEVTEITDDINYAAGTVVPLSVDGNDGKIENVTCTGCTYNATLGQFVLDGGEEHSASFDFTGSKDYVVCVATYNDYDYDEEEWVNPEVEPYQFNKGQRATIDFNTDEFTNVKDIVVRNLYSATIEYQSDLNLDVNDDYVASGQSTLCNIYGDINLSAGGDEENADFYEIKEVRKNDGLESVYSFWYDDDDCCLKRTIHLVDDCTIRIFSKDYVSNDLEYQVDEQYEIYSENLESKLPNSNTIDINGKGYFKFAIVYDRVEPKVSATYFEEDDEEPVVLEDIKANSERDFGDKYCKQYLVGFTEGIHDASIKVEPKYSTSRKVNITNAKPFTIVPVKAINCFYDNGLYFSVPENDKDSHVEFKFKLKESDKVIVKQYENGATEGTEVVPDSEGIYKLSKASVTGLKIVPVYEASFETNENYVITGVDGKAIEKLYSDEDGNIAFKINLTNTKCTIEKVLVGDKEVAPSADGVYKTKIEADVNISVDVKSANCDIDVKITDAIKEFTVLDSASQEVEAVKEENGIRTYALEIGEEYEFEVETYFNTILSSVEAKDAEPVTIAEFEAEKQSNTFSFAFEEDCLIELICTGKTGIFISEYDADDDYIIDSLAEVWDVFKDNEPVEAVKDETGSYYALEYGKKYIAVCLENGECKAAPQEQYADKQSVSEYSFGTLIIKPSYKDKAGLYTIEYNDGKQSLRYCLPFALSEVTVNADGKEYVFDGSDSSIIEVSNEILSTSTVTIKNVAIEGIKSNLDDLEIDVEGEYTTFDIKYESGSDTAVITIKYSDKISDNSSITLSSNTTGSILGKIDVKTLAPAFANEKLKDVKFVESDDTSMMFDVKAPENINKEIGVSRYQYHFVVEPLGENIPDSIKEKAIIVPLESFDKTQRIDIKINDVEPGYGQACQYKVYVYFELLNEELNDSLFKSDTFELDAETKEPFYETKLKLNKVDAAKAVYTGQKNVYLGCAEFMSDTSLKKACVEDATACDDSMRLNVYIGDDGRSIYAEADSDTLVGAHTLQVYPVVKEGMYVEPVKYVVNVKRGIENIELTTNTLRVNKIAGKQLSVPTKIIFNDGKTVPALNKVEYLVELTGESDIASTYIKVTASGVVVIDKAFVPEEDGDYQFCVIAKANDYAGNEVTAKSAPVRISANKIVLDSVKIYKENESGTYDEIGVPDEKGVISVTSDKVQGAKIFAVENGKELKQTGESLDVLNEVAVPLSDIAFTSSNKAVAVKDNELTALKAANNVLIKATAKDGGKSAAQVKLNVIYAVPEELALVIEAGDHRKLCNESANEFIDAVSPDELIKFSVNSKQPGEEQYTKIDSFVNHTFTIKGGAIIKADKNAGEYYCVVNTAKATVTLTYNKGKTKQIKTVTVYNRMLETTYAAPKARITGDVLTLKAGDSKGATMKILVDDKNINYSKAGVFGSFNSVARIKDKKGGYDRLDEALGISSYSDEPLIVPFNEDKTVSLTFADDVPLIAGNYKFDMIVITEKDNDECVLKPVSITIKVVAPKVKKGSIAPVTSYKFARDGVTKKYSEVALKYSGKDVQDMNWNEYYLCNNAGYPGEFDKYFTVTKSENGMTVALKEDLSQEDIEYLASAKSAGDRTIYVSYTAHIGDDGYGKPYTTVEKTVKMVMKVTK